MRRVGWTWVLWTSAAAAQTPPIHELETVDTARRGAPVEPERTALEGAVDPSAYIVGPGDRLLVELWGLRDLTTEVEVNAEGRLLVPRVGQFRAGGETLARVRGLVEERLRAVYPTLRGGVTLARPRTFLVHVVGAVARPGTYTATPVTRVSAMVARAGGPLPRGSTRAVEVRRGGAIRQIADLIRFTLLGERDGDPTVLDGDTLFVPLRQVEVEVSGAVRRPGRYELTRGRDVDEALELAGGTSSEAAAGLPVRLSARAEGDRVAVRSLSLAAARVETLHDGDRVYVPALADLRRTVVVEGAVVGPEPGPARGGAPAERAVELQRAPYNTDRRADAPVSAPREVSVPVPFVDGDGVRDLLHKAGGLQPWAEARSAFLLRAARDGSRRRIAVDVPAIASGQAPEVPVEAGDTLVVPSRRESVLVGGAVQRPGLYQYSPSLRPVDYLDLAGGPTRSGDVGGARVLGRGGGSRRLAKVSAIEPGDAINVPERILTTGEWISLTMILGNIAVAATAVAITAVR